MSEMTPQQVAELASSRAFGTRLITNVLRGLVVEAIVSTSLCPEWRWCSEDYFQYDFEHLSMGFEFSPLSGLEFSPMREG